jgi:hypothetical protein
MEFIKSALVWDRRISRWGHYLASGPLGVFKFGNVEVHSTTPSLALPLLHDDARAPMQKYGDDRLGVR